MNEAEIRKQLQDAIVETAWTYFLKGKYIQYDSETLTAIEDKTVGVYRNTEGQSPEFATSDNTLFSVCSYYCYDTYKNAVNYLVGGSVGHMVRTAHIWENVRDETLVLRWSSLGEEIVDAGYPEVRAAKDANDFGAWFAKHWKTFLEPGDIMVFIRKGGAGHATMYAGAEMMLECMGKKYDGETGLDRYEPYGSIQSASVDYYFLNEESKRAFSRDDGKLVERFFVIRPINRIKSVEAINPWVQSRIQYPGMIIDRTVDITPFGTTAKGENLTYTVRITNESNNTEDKERYRETEDGTHVNYRNWHGAYYGKPNYQGSAYCGLPVQETVPAGTELVCAEGATVEGRTIRWRVDLQPGETAVLSYTVKVTAEVGETIVCGGGFVDKIPSNTICNRVGGKKLLLDKVAAFRENPASFTQLLQDKGVAQGVYEAAFGANLSLDPVQVLFDKLFRKETVAGTDMLVRNQPNAMLVDRFFGGYRVHTDHLKQERVWDYNVRYFEPGDILITGALENMDTLKVQRSNVLVYLGDGWFASADETGAAVVSEDPAQYVSVFRNSNDFFFLLRPSQCEEK